MLDAQPAVLRLTIGRLLLLLAAAGVPSPTATAVAGHVIPAKSVEYADVSAAVNQAADGDTVEVPAGTAAWSQQLKITKGITLAGKTTTRGAGTKNATASDQTIIIVNDARLNMWASMLSAAAAVSTPLDLTACGRDRPISCGIDPARRLYLRSR